MPIQNGRDARGPYYRWGDSGKKYYYLAGHVRSRKAAHDRALRQARAIEASKRRRVK
jgi:hypothetical protein